MVKPTSKVNGARTGARRVVDGETWTLAWVMARTGALRVADDGELEQVKLDWWVDDERIGRAVSWFTIGLVVGMTFIALGMR